MAKKSFITKDNPAMSFISQESIDKVEKPERTPTGAKKAPEGYKANPAFIETKSKRVQILTTPSLYEDAKALSAKLGISLNDFINRAVQEATYNSQILEQIQKDIRG